MRILLAATFALAVALAGCSSDDDAATSGTTTTATTSAPVVDHTPKTHTVPIQGNAFVNGTLEVMQGDTVAWQHQDGATTAHTVTADDGSFDSSPNCEVGLPLSQVCMVEGDTFQETFQEPGTYAYHCKVHPAMTGTVTVLPHDAGNAAA